MNLKKILCYILGHKEKIIGDKRLSGMKMPPADFDWRDSKDLINHMRKGLKAKHVCERCGVTLNE